MPFERKENRGEYQYRRDPEDEVVEIFGRPADNHADRDVARSDFRMIGGDRTGVALEGSR